MGPVESDLRTCMQSCFSIDGLIGAVHDCGSAVSLSLSHQLCYHTLLYAECPILGVEAIHAWYRQNAEVLLNLKMLSSGRYISVWCTKIGYTSKARSEAHFAQLSPSRKTAMCGAPM